MELLCTTQVLHKNFGRSDQDLASHPIFKSSQPLKAQKS